MILSWIRRIKQRLHDMATINRLCTCAEVYARRMGEAEPGEEHFILAAIDLPDGTARQVFEALGLTASDIENGIKQQYVDALQQIGIERPEIEAAHVEEMPKRLLYQAKPSVQQLMQSLIEARKTDKITPLVGASVIQALIEKRHGVAARTLQVLGVDKQKLRNAIKDVMQQYLNPV